MLMGLLLILAACNGGDTGNTVTGGGVITWDRSPETVVFRAEVVGGQSEGTFLARNEIPLCSIYGDNRVVWLNELGDSDVQVLWDKVTDQQIKDLISVLTITRRLFTYDAGADLQPPSGIKPVFEVLAVNVSGRSHQTDSFSSEEWPLGYFEENVNLCKQVSRAPVLFEPDGVWLTVQTVDYDSTRPLQVWDGSTAGLDFNEQAAKNDPTWLTGPNLRIMWDIVRTSSPNTLFIDLESNAFEVVLEVPGIHPASPPAP